jgi:hypothetical protein
VEGVVGLKTLHPGNPLPAGQALSISRPITDTEGVAVNTMSKREKNF